MLKGRKHGAVDPTRRRTPLRIETDRLKVSLDAGMVERIVENLLTNVARHTPEGTPVWVSTEPRGDVVLITVADAGPGVPTALMRSVFEPFGQGASMSASSPGVGIGLSLVTRFAELHGGRAWVESRPGGGAAFKVFVPGPLGDKVPIEAVGLPCESRTACVRIGPPRRRARATRAIGAEPLPEQGHERRLGW
jgi:signal transduction histidine kinase